MTNLPVSGEFHINVIYGATGPYWKNGHKGVDLLCANHNIYATCDGTVRVVAFDSGGWGQYVSIGDSEGRRHIFCHLEKGSVKVKAGQKVNRSTVIGIMGSTGNSTGLHLHYQIEDEKGNVLNPCLYMGIPNKEGRYNSKDYEIKEVSSMAFKDEKKIGDWAKDAVAKCEKAGLFKGDENGNFRPRDPITREELAVVLARALKL